MKLTRFVSRPSVFVSLALEPTPDRVPELLIHPLELRELAVKLTVTLIVNLIVDIPQLLVRQHPLLFWLPDTGFYFQPQPLLVTLLAQLVSDRELFQRSLNICRHEELSHCACLTPTACMLDTRLRTHTSQHLFS